MPLTILSKNVLLVGLFQFLRKSLRSNGNYLLFVERLPLVEIDLLDSLS